jgi:hypothetical protein
MIERFQFPGRISTDDSRTSALQPITSRYFNPAVTQLFPAISSLSRPTYNWPPTNNHCCILTMETLPLYLSNVKSLGGDVCVPAGIVRLRLRRHRNFAPELIYYNDGSVLSFVMAVEVGWTNRVVLSAAVLRYGAFAVCQLQAEFDLS